MRGGGGGGGGGAGWWCGVVVRALPSDDDDDDDDDDDNDNAGTQWEKSENTLPTVVRLPPDVVVRGFWIMNSRHSIHLMIQIFTIYIVEYKKIYILPLLSRLLLNIIHGMQAGTVV